MYIYVSYNIIREVDRDLVNTFRRSTQTGQRYGEAQHYKNVLNVPRSGRTRSDTHRRGPRTLTRRSLMFAQRYFLFAQQALSTPPLATLTCWALCMHLYNVQVFFTLYIYVDARCRNRTVAEKEKRVCLFILLVAIRKLNIRGLYNSRGSKNNDFKMFCVSVCLYAHTCHA